MLDEESSKEAQQIDHMNIDQPKEPISIENVITPTPRKSAGYLILRRDATFSMKCKSCIFMKKVFMLMILLHIKTIYVI